MGKKRSRQQQVEEEDVEEVVKNKKRVLMLSSRGITERQRHLMTDLLKLLPHSVKESKLDTKEEPSVINEVALSPLH
jgi:ribosome biogenesis protein BRX1